MKITVWQCRPNYHDLSMYKSLVGFGHDVSFVFDIVKDCRDNVDVKNELRGFTVLKLCAYNMREILALARNSEVNIIVGGTAFYSTLIAHVFGKRERNIFVSEGRYSSDHIKYKIRDILESYLCHSALYLAIGDNARSYFGRIYGDNIALEDFGYYYLSNKLLAIDCPEEYKDPNRFKPNVGYVGRGEYHKGFDIFLDLAESLPDITFNFTGKMHPSFRARAASLDNLNVVNWVHPSDVLSRMACMDILIVPSRIEPFGCVVQEGVIAGCLVLCSQYVGARSLARMFPDNVNVIDDNTMDSYRSHILAYKKHRFKSKRINPEEIGRFGVEFGVSRLIEKLEIFKKAGST